MSNTGRPSRRFFLTLREAKAYGDFVRRQFEDHQFDSTYLSRDQLAEASKAYKLIAEVSAETQKQYALLQIVEEWSRRERLASKSVTLDQLIGEYIGARSSISKQYVRDIESLKERLPSLGWKIVSTLTPADIESAVRHETPSVRNSHLRILRALLNYGAKKGYLPENPIAKLEFSRVALGEVQLYTPDDVQKLLDDCLEHDLELLPYRVLTIYCGIRPRGEMSRLQWSDIDWADHIVKLRAAITKKGRTRHPQISDNAKEWLEEYRARGGTTTGLVVGCTQKQLEAKIAANHKRTGIKSAKNAARHSYCSYHLAYHNDINGLTLQSGHASTDTLWKHYYRVARREDAERFWSVLPKTRTIPNVIAFANS